MGAATGRNVRPSRGELVLGAACHVVERDTELMCRVRDGDPQAYALLLDRYRRPLIHFLCRFVQAPHIAEELAQEVFLRVYKSRASYEPTAKFGTWLFRIATHVAVNWLRDGKHEKNGHSLDDEAGSGVLHQVADRTSSIEERLLARVRVREIRRAISSLPPNQRAAILLHKYQEIPYSQIACALDCSEGAVKSLLFRAYERLRKQLTHFSA